MSHTKTRKSPCSSGFLCVMLLDSADSGVRLSAYKVKRLEQYANNMVDYHQVMDLLPTLSHLYFSGIVRVHLSAVQEVSLC